MIGSRLSVTAGKVVKSSAIRGPGQSGTAGKHDVKAVILEAPMGGSAPSTMIHGGPGYNTTFSGILPDYNEAALLQFYRDCYYYDSVAGATVDIISNFPFSDWTLAGVDNAQIAKYSESLARLNTRALLQEISMSYMVDGAFIGSLVYNRETKIFQDMLMHDTANSMVSPQPFYSLDPVITVNSADRLNQFFDAGSPYTKAMMSSYPQGQIDTFRAGPVILDPLTTLYLPRKGLTDRQHVSYLKRLLPVYLLEKIMYRGTLTEASKRLRSTTHIQIGDDTWEPTPAEIQSILADFQRTEMDPLGAWIATRQGVNVTDIRQGGDFWKWTDLIDTLTPFKLRALGISEAFLSSDANYSTAEAAISVFMDNMNAYRQRLTYQIFTSKIFPLIAVLNGYYKDPKEARQIKTAGDFTFNVQNQKNLQIPEVRWHKSLEGKEDENEFETLEKLSEKGFTIPLKMWAAAAGVDVTSILHDLEEDEIIRKKIAAVTGIKPDEMTGGNTVSDDSEDQEDMRFSFKNGPPIASMASGFMKRSRPLLSREFGAEARDLNKSGSGFKAVYNQKAATQRTNEMIMKASQALKDPEHRARIRKQVQDKLHNTDMKL